MRVLTLAQQDLADRHLHLALRYGHEFAWRLALPVDDCEEAALLAILQAACGWRHESAFSTYLWHCIRGRVLDVMKARAREQQRFIPLYPDVEGCVGVECQALMRISIDKALSRLSPRLRSIFLRHARGESGKEIAARVGISPVGVRTNCNLARKILKRELAA